MEFILLEDCCEILDSLRIPITASDREKGIYPYYGANGIQDYVSSYIFDDDLVLLAEDGGSFGSKTKPIAYRVSGKCWVNNHAHVLKPKEGIDVDFLCYSLMFYNTKGLVNGATRQKLTQSAIRKMKIPKLHIDIQLDIVKEIKSVISIIDNREKQLEKLSLLVRARFVEMFGDLVVNPYKWTVVKLSDISLFLKSGLSRRLSDVDIGLPVIRSGNIQNGQFVYNDIKYWYKDDPQGANTEDYRLENGDILVNFINSASQIGKTAIFSGVNRECIYTTNILRMKLTDSCNIYYYNWFAMSDYYYRQLRNIIQPAVNQASFTTVNFLKLNIPLPPLKLQKQFETFVHQVNKSKLIIYYHHKSIYTKPQLCCKMVIVNDFLNTKRFCINKTLRICSLV